MEYTKNKSDGVIISEKGVSCPNVFAEVYNFHSIYDYPCQITSYGKSGDLRNRNSSG